VALIVARPARRRVAAVAVTGTAEPASPVPDTVAATAGGGAKTR